jgi:hypothetical protein
VIALQQLAHEVQRELLVCVPRGIVTDEQRLGIRDGHHGLLGWRRRHHERPKHEYCTQTIHHRALSPL